jgi:hypothetical protein
MQVSGLKGLAERVESAEEASTALVSEVAEALAAAYPRAASRAVADGALQSSTDAALHVADRALPGWEILRRDRVRPFSIVAARPDRGAAADRRDQDWGLSGASIPTGLPPPAPRSP